MAHLNLRQSLARALTAAAATTIRPLSCGMTAGLLAIILAAPGRPMAAADAVRVDRDDLGGVVTSAKGPEAGVWVIAETRDLPTGFRKIVVTDDRGRYLVPDLPQGTYDIWVRGYGLVDSARVTASPGRNLNLTAVIAPDARAAAQYYPANYWYSLLEPPARSEFPGTGPQGNGISESLKVQEQFLAGLSQNGCTGGCHQMGTKATREMPSHLASATSPEDAWDRRVQFGQSANIMNPRMSAFGRKRGLQMFADWTTRIANGELPPVPPRPQGPERNIVITEWDWGTPTQYVYDARASNEAKPTVNANGPIYGAPMDSADALLVLDPVRHVASEIPVRVIDDARPPVTGQAMRSGFQPSPHWGPDAIWTGVTGPHNPMFDLKGRVWVNTAVRPSGDEPAWCRAGSSHPSARLVPLDASNRQLWMYDPVTRISTPIDTCFPTRNIDISPDGTLWFEGGGLVGWFSTKIWDETHDLQKAQGWVPFILDTNANGRQDAFVAPNQPRDPTKDTRILGDATNEPDVAVSAAHGAIWVAGPSTPGSLIRVSLGANPPFTSLAEIYEPPFGNPTVPTVGYSLRGLEVDSNDVAWPALGSGHLASFDRRKCKVLNGPTATGQHCPEGWTFYPDPGPRFKGTNNGSDGHYHSWVDQFDASGLGKDTPISMGTNSDALLALLPATGKWVVFRVPYPMGWYVKGVDGRIDDPKGGWKGRGLWSTYSGQVMWHQETGKGSTSKVLKFQLRPNPLAK